MICHAPVDSFDPTSSKKNEGNEWDFVREEGLRAEGAQTWEARTTSIWSRPAIAVKKSHDFFKKMNSRWKEKKQLQRDADEGEKKTQRLSDKDCCRGFFVIQSFFSITRGEPLHKKEKKKRKTNGAPEDRAAGDRAVGRDVCLFHLRA